MNQIFLLMNLFNNCCYLTDIYDNFSFLKINFSLRISFLLFFSAYGNFLWIFCIHSFQDYCRVFKGHWKNVKWWAWGSSIAYNWARKQRWAQSLYLHSFSNITITNITLYPHFYFFFNITFLNYTLSKFLVNENFIFYQNCNCNKNCNRFNFYLLNALNN